MANSEDTPSETNSMLSTYDRLRRFTGSLSGLALLLMCLGDIYVHPTLAESLPKHRRLLKTFLDDFMLGRDAREIVSHIGNSFLSAAPAIGIVMVGEYCRFVGERNDKKYLKVMANIAPPIAFTTVIGLNFIEELYQAQFDSFESMGDIRYGLIAGALGIITTLSARIPAVLRSLSDPAPITHTSAVHTPSGRLYPSASC